MTDENKMRRIEDRLPGEPLQWDEESAQEEIASLHRRVAAEKLRADQGWTRAEAKSKECIELRERMVALAPATDSATDWRPYHSALSRCAELLDNMKDGDPITDVPDFLAAKLKQCHLASQSQAARPSDLDAFEAICPKVYTDAERELLWKGWQLAGQSQATRAVPEGWNVKRVNVSGTHRIVIESDKQMRSITSDGEPTLFRFFSDLLVAAPTAQEVTQQAQEAMKQKLRGLVYAASAVVERWDSPKWKDEPHTAEFIHRLRAAIAEASSNSSSQEVTQQAAKAETAEQAKPIAAAVRAAERIDAMHKGVVGVFAAIKAEHLAQANVLPPVAPKGPFADYSAEEVEAYASAYAAAPLSLLREILKQHDEHGELIRAEGDHPVPNPVAERIRALLAGVRTSTRLDTPLTRAHLDLIRHCAPSEVDAATAKFFDLLSDLLPTTSTVSAPTDAARDVLVERQRQVEVEGWTPERDDKYINCELARAAATYATCSHIEQLKLCGEQVWPWRPDWWKCSTYRRDLTKAGALILAEIERLDRDTLRTTSGKGEA